MSEKNTKNSLTLQQVTKKSLITFLILLLVSVSISLITAFLLNMTSVPEMVYPYSGYVILALSSYITGKLYLKNLNASRISIIGISSLFFILITALVAVAINNGETAITPIIIKLALIFLLMLLSSSFTKKKRKKKNTKRR